jgi:hypothetical protein
MKYTFARVVLRTTGTVTAIDTGEGDGPVTRLLVRSDSQSHEVPGDIDGHVQ